MTDMPSVHSAPLQYNLLKLYRQHRDEIDTLSDPTTLFILDLTSHYGQIPLDELAGDLGLAPTTLRKKIAPLLRGQMIVESEDAVTVTTLGKRLLDHIDFLPPLAVSSEAPTSERKMKVNAQPQVAASASTPSWLWGVIAFLGIAAMVLFLILIAEIVWLVQTIH